MNPLISVVVPVYKVEKYLDRCVESIVNQTYENLEIILVDDGSPDNCPAMCDAWAEKDDRIKVIHKENGGLANARNSGIDIAAGDYIGFVDSDDYIEPEMYEQLLQSIIVNNSEISMCGYRDVSEDEEIIRENNFTSYPSCTDFEAMYTVSVNSLALVITCNKLYKKKLWIENRFANYRVYEDEATIPYICAEAKRISIIQCYSYYNYRCVENSIIHSTITENNFVIFDILSKRLGYIKGNYSEKCYINALVLALKTLRYVGIVLINQQNCNEIKKKFKEKFLHFYNEYVQFSKLSIKIRMLYFVFAYFPNFYLYLCRF